MVKKSIGVTSLMHCLILHHSWKIWDQILKPKRNGGSCMISALPEKGSGTLESQVEGDSLGVTPGWIGNSKIFQIGQSDIGTSFEAISDSWTNEWLRRNGLPHHKIFLNFSSCRNNFSIGGCTIIVSDINDMFISVIQWPVSRKCSPKDLPNGKSPILEIAFVQY